MVSPMLVVFLIVSFVNVNVGQFAKQGECRSHVKRSICQCPPQGTDNCLDHCENDRDCPGVRKCCPGNCRRECALPVRMKPVVTVPQQCPQGEEFNVCGPFRPATCVNPVANRTRCVSGCNCPSEYVRSQDGRCVKKIECPGSPGFSVPVCAGRHEVYHHCHQSCQGSCSNLKAVGCNINSCVAGCYCTPGYVRSGTGRCVLPSACTPIQVQVPAPTPPPPECSNGQEFNACRKECEPSCTNPTTSGCYRSCQVGCFCRSGLVRDHWGNCITLDSCPRLTTRKPLCVGPNENFLMCHPKCQKTCDDPTGQQNCYSRCVTGCFCDDGYVRYANRCIPPDQCPPPARPDAPPAPSVPICENDLEVYEACYGGCERTCSNPTGSGCQSNQCVPGCYCRGDLVRSHTGHCVHQSNCPSCGFHEIMEECAPACPTTCPPSRVCETDNCQPGCQCEPGYIKNVTDGNCIANSQCPTYKALSGGCGADEEQVNCGSICETQCSEGWSSSACPSSCKRRCCRKRRFN